MIFTQELPGQNKQEITRKKQGKTVCLNMIVKDESPVIKRSLASVKHLIDYWVIVDTGSKDDTKEIIREFMKDIPGELHERPWVNFEHNRNEALQLAKNKGNYLLFIDADEQLDFAQNFSLPVLDKDVYSVIVRQQGFECLRVLLINTALDWKWKGVVHEEMTCATEPKDAILEGAAILAHFEDGHRTQDPDKFFKDARLLEEALQKDPTNTRYMSFLGQSYLCAKDWASALKAFQKRSEMGGRDEEVFWALYQIGSTKELLNYPSEDVISSYCKAYQFRPSRSEPLFRLGRYYCLLNNYVLGYAVSKLAASIPFSKDGVYVSRAIYDYQLPFLVAHCAFYLGKIEEAHAIFAELLKQTDLPTSVREEIASNVEVTENRLKELKQISLNKAVK